MRLDEWLDQQGPGSRTRLHFATGLRLATIVDIANGKSRPRPDTAKRIEAATEGAVTAAELLGIGPTGGEAAQMRQAPEGYAGSDAAAEYIRTHAQESIAESSE